jgi:hypothetical protein
MSPLAAAAALACASLTSRIDVVFHHHNEADETFVNGN